VNFPASPLITWAALCTAIAGASVARAQCYIYVIEGYSYAGKGSTHPETDAVYDNSVDMEKALKGGRCKLHVVPTNTPARELKADLEKFVRDQRLTKEDSIHFAFSGHGAPPYRSIKTDLDQSIALSHFGNLSAGITYRQFGRLLTETLPDKMHVTYSATTCWPRFHALANEPGLATKFQICGGAPAGRDDLSGTYRNHSYVKKGWEHVYSHPGAGMFELHGAGAKFYAGNNLAGPGDLSSIAFTRSVLKDRYPAVYPSLRGHSVRKHLFSVNFQRRHTVLPPSLKIAGTRFQNLISSVLSSNGLRLDCETAKAFDEVYELEDTLTRITDAQMKGEIANLDSGWRKVYNSAVTTLTDPAFQEATDKLIRKGAEVSDVELEHTLAPYAHAVRQLEDVQAVIDFKEVATPAERANYDRLVACERKPL